jgi:VHL beta domain
MSYALVSHRMLILLNMALVWYGCTNALEGIRSWFPKRKDVVAMRDWGPIPDQTLQPLAEPSADSDFRLWRDAPAWRTLMLSSIGVSAMLIALPLINIESSRSTKDAVACQAVARAAVGYERIGTSEVMNELGSSALGGECSCSLEQSLKSLSGDSRATVTFQNLSGVAMRAYWLNYAGQRIFYREINSGGGYTQPTYITHPWVLVDATGECRKIVLPGVSAKVVNFQ